jgi:hypothetical protein
LFSFKEEKSEEIILTIFVTVLILIGLNSLPAQAALVDNGNYSTDDVTGLDWLHLDQTAGRSWGDVEANLTGGDFDGWRFATGEEFETMVTGMGGTAGSYTGYSFSNNGVVRPLLVNHFGDISGVGNYYASGFIADMHPVFPDSRWSARLYDSPTYWRSILEDYIFTFNSSRTASYQHSTQGSYLVREEASEPDIDISLLFHSFGDVELGLSSTVIVNISNVGNTDLTIDFLDFGSGGKTEFFITSTVMIPLVISPDTTSDDITITYTPLWLGVSTDTLGISSDDPDEPLVQVEFEGNCVTTDLGSAADVIQEFIDDSVSAGSLEGNGPGKSAGNRLNALQNMINAAGDLFEKGDVDGACEQLRDIHSRTDGLPKPPDFVTGVAAVELATRILDLMEEFGCE